MVKLRKMNNALDTRHGEKQHAKSKQHKLVCGLLGIEGHEMSISRRSRISGHMPADNNCSLNIEVNSTCQLASNAWYA